MEEEERAIIQRILRRAEMKVGSAARCAETLGISLTELRSYREGEAKPADAVLLRAVDLILDEIPAIRVTFSARAWNALSLPKR